MRNLLIALLFVFSFQAFSQSDSISLSILSTNLSENFSQSDELILLMYYAPDSSGQIALYFAKELQITTLSTPYRLRIPSYTENMLFLVLERDSETALDSIAATVSETYSTLLPAFSKRDYSTIEDLIGDDDVLGYKHIDALTTEIVFEGIYKMDKYRYIITVQR